MLSPAVKGDLYVGLYTLQSDGMIMRCRALYQPAGRFWGPRVPLCSRLQIEWGACRRQVHCFKSTLAAGVYMWRHRVLFGSWPGSFGAFTINNTVTSLSGIARTKYDAFSGAQTALCNALQQNVVFVLCTETLEVKKDRPYSNQNVKEVEAGRAGRGRGGDPLARKHAGR